MKHHELNKTASCLKKKKNNLAHRLECFFFSSDEIWKGALVNELQEARIRFKCAGSESGLCLFSLPVRSHRPGRIGCRLGGGGFQLHHSKELHQLRRNFCQHTLSKRFFGSLEGRKDQKWKTVQHLHSLYVL